MSYLADSLNDGIPKFSLGRDGADDVPAREQLLALESETRVQLKLGAGDPAWFDEKSIALLTRKAADSPQLRSEVALLFFQWHAKEASWERAFDLAAMAVDLAQRAQAPALVRRALNSRGLAQSRLRDIAGAIASYIQALDIADRIGDRAGKAATLANLAEARFNAGLLSESIALNRFVIDLSVNEPQMMVIRAGANHNIALASLLLDDIDTAYSEIQLALEATSEPEGPFMALQRVIMETTHCRVLLRLSRLAEAQLSMKVAVKYAEKAASRPARIHAQLVRALCQAAAGDCSNALEQLSALRGKIKDDEPLFRDFLEIELLCNFYAGERRFALYYQERYLLDLARFQRNGAIAQVRALQRGFRTGGCVSEAELLALPELVRRRIVNRSSMRSEEMFLEQLEAIASLAEQRDDATGEHALRVGKLVSYVAAASGFCQSQAEQLELAARLHDIGKLAVPDVLLLKCGRLTGKEVEVMQRHTWEGCQILTDVIGSVERERRLSDTKHLVTLRLGAEIALTHHERWDGSGYPRGLAGTAIPESARITAIADVFDELVHTHPYKDASSIDVALAEIVSQSGRQFEPRLCAIFASVIEELRQSYGHELEKFAVFECPESAYLKAKRVVDRIVEAARSGSA